ncbi:MAG: ABC transporter permease [Candidatus Njordarchaeales archaeon]
MGLKEYAIRRVFTGLITLLVVIAANWFIFRLPVFIIGIDPGTLYGISQMMNNPTGRESIRAIQTIVAYKRQWGLPSINAPIGVWLHHFAKYYSNMLQFKFGKSIGQPVPNVDVTRLLLARLPVTLMLLTPAVLLSIVIGIWLGVKMGANPGSRFDVTMMTILMMLYALPVFWLQVLFKIVFINALKVWPGVGLHSTTTPIRDPILSFLDSMYMLSLPIITLIIGGFGGWAILMRNSLVDVMTQDYILTARAKGLDERTVLYKHAFRNAILPVVTSVILAIAGVWTGAVLTEQIFSIPGVGQLIVQAVIADNYPLAEMTFYFIALSTIVANIIADISYALLDPRVKY